MAHYITDANSKRIKVAGSYGSNILTKINNLAMFPDTQNKITLSTSLTSYTPTINGWIVVTCARTSTDSYLQLLYDTNATINSPYGTTVVTGGTASRCIASLFVPKGKTVYIDTKNCNVDSMKFVPAKEI